MEKVKDFLYDISDFVFSLLIILVIFILVSWKLADTMQFSFLNGFNSDDTVEFGDNIDPSIGDIDTNIIEDTTDTTDVTVPDDTTDTETPDTSDDVLVEIKDIDFEIAPGTSPGAVADSLEAQGLVSSASEFTSKLVERELDKLIRAGSFTLSTDMSIDEIINKLTGN